jgi:glycosyltransferase involved in cell wall biosynthesis
MNASVVVPTRNRRDQLARCIDALKVQRTERSYELIVVDDGSLPPLLEADTRPAVLIRGRGEGPAAARNAGIAHAQGDFVLFTDDDAIPDLDWVEAACDFLERNPDYVGVGGRTVSPRFDYLYEHSVECDDAAFWTCNVAYRRDALQRLGGFYEGFRDAHCEDLDLGYRALEVGQFGFEPNMRVFHVPRRLSVWEHVRRGRLAASETLLCSRHPDRYPTPRWLPRRMLVPAGVLTRWAEALRVEGLALASSPRRLARFLAVAAGHSFVAVVSALRTQQDRSARL